MTVMSVWIIPFKRVYEQKKNRNENSKGNLFLARQSRNNSLQDLQHLPSVFGIFISPHLFRCCTFDPPTTCFVCVFVRKGGHKTKGRGTEKTCWQKQKIANAEDFQNARNCTSVRSLLRVCSHFGCTYFFEREYSKGRPELRKKGPEIRAQRTSVPKCCVLISPADQPKLLNTCRLHCTRRLGDMCIYNWAHTQCKVWNKTLFHIPAFYFIPGKPTSATAEYPRYREPRQRQNKETRKHLHANGATAAELGHVLRARGAIGVVIVIAIARVRW